mgnify:CR=1 FL=1
MFVSSASFSSATDSDRTTARSFVQSSGRSTLAGVHRRSLDLSLPANGDGPHVPLSVERKEDQFKVTPIFLNDPQSSLTQENNGVSNSSHVGHGHCVVRP